MPPLPENGPTVEMTALDLDPKGLDDSPVPSAISREEETAEATEEDPNPVVASKKAKRRRMQVSPSTSSSPSMDTDLKDDATSHSPPHKQASPLKACPLSSMPPAPVSGDIVFGGPGSIPSLSDDEERYVFHFMTSFGLCCFFSSGTSNYVFCLQRCGGCYKSSTRSCCLTRSGGFSCECTSALAAGDHSDHSCSIFGQGSGGSRPCGVILPSCDLGRACKCLTLQFSMHLC